MYIKPVRLLVLTTENSWVNTVIISYLNKSNTFGSDISLKSSTEQCTITTKKFRTV